MIKKTLLITRESSLSLKSQQLRMSFCDDGTERSIPIEDIGYVVLESHRITISAPLLSALSENNVCVIVTDRNMMPISMLQTLDGNSIQQEIYRNQLAASAPLMKGLWKQVVSSKIGNQARLLEKLGKDSGPLRWLSKNVKSGDTDNREGVAAKVYWGKLFGGEFSRDRFGCGENPLLNYGYSILRAATARALTGSGLLPSVGIFHRNRYNAFPLADDMMEPFRPFVDEIVYNLVLEGKIEMTKDVKAELLSVLTCDTWYSDRIKPLSVGLASTTSSLVKCFTGVQRKLVLPELII